jgi:CheY-like chemotaxis protein/signal transduction histidine kinase
MLNQLKIRTKIGLSFALGLGIFAAIAAISYRGITQLIETSQWQEHTYEVLNQLEQLNASLVKAETGQRGYIITGELKYLEPFNTTRRELPQKIKALRRLITDNPNQQSRLNTLEPLLSDRINVMQQVITLRQQGFVPAQQAIQSDRGRQLMERIGQTIAEMKIEEQTLLKQRSDLAQLASRQTLESVIYGVPLYSILLLLLGFLLTRNISRPLRQISKVAEKIGDGDLTVRVPIADRQDEIGLLSQVLNETIANLQITTERNEQQSWLKSNLADITQRLQGERQPETVGSVILSRLAELVNAQQGLFYVLDNETKPPVLKLLSSYAHQERKHLSNQFRLGEGLVGQCALEKQRILLTNVPQDYIRISSGLGDAVPLNLVVQPILFESQVVAAIELASFHRFSDLHLSLLEQVSQGLGAVLSAIAADIRTNQLFQQSQTLTEQLRQSNQELESQTEELQASEMLLREQQQELQQSNEELQQLNEELEEKAELLAAQKREVEHKNQEIEQARQGLEQQAEQLQLSSRYKSQFLANMSHELRTPLNSLLILAKLLSDNIEGNLTAKQVQYSRTIHTAGNDLLNLINDILDLAKIESGTVALEAKPVALVDLCGALQQTFQQLAHEKGLNFQIELDAAVPLTIVTDAKRLQQILKNLLSNAFKFTNQGSVTLKISPMQFPTDPSRTAIAFAVTDTGIGIAADKQQLIFEAFQQADGSTSRNYGGTGLGLSISRELAHLLGGQITLASQPEQGSTFTFYLPTTSPSPSSPAPLSPPPPSPPPPASDFADDRATLQPHDRVLLIIEDDTHFVSILVDLARQAGFKTLVALRSSSGLALAKQYKPNAIMLDIRLPDGDGWTVLDQLKRNPNTRHIPVHILSVDEAQQRGLQQGAIAYLQKPVSPEALNQAFQNINQFIDQRIKNLLVVEDDKVQAESIRELIGNGDVQTTIVGTGTAALAALQSQSFDCIVLDLGLPDMPDLELIERIKLDPTLARLPIVVYTGKDLTPQQETQLKRLAETIIIKDVRSPERLLDETALFLHRVQANLPPPKQKILEQLHQSDSVLSHKSVLIVDDDVRNIFALTSLLEGYQMQVRYAENGTDAIALLQADPTVNVVLMDVMMPGMDGYETTQQIRQQPQFKSLPIIALTAKAMQGDREKCLEAGASDYITKPVNTEQLLSLLRVWLYS